MMSWATSRRVPGLVLLLVAAAFIGGSGHAAPANVFPGGVVTLADCCNNSGAATGSPSTGSPYPSAITVPASVTGLVTDVKVSVVLDHTWPDDLDLLLVSPSGTKVLLMSDVGGNAGNAITPDTLLLSDPGGPISDITQLQDGTFQPTNTGSDCDNSTEASDVFPSPAPGGPYSTALSAFNGASPVGAWNLYAVDDCNLGNTLGARIQSWALDITAKLTAVSLTSFTAARTKRGVELKWRTGAETELLGFDVFRFSAGKPMAKVNRKLIPAKGAASSRGAVYRLLDRRARAGRAATYRLRAATIEGRRYWSAKTTVKATR